MRQTKILFDTIFCGTLTETDDGEFTFKYDDGYVNQYPDQFITFTMPVRTEKYLVYFLAGDLLVYNLHHSIINFFSHHF